MVTVAQLIRNGTLASVLLLAAFLAAWQRGPGLFGIPTFIVPPLSTVAHEFVHAWQFDHLLFHTSVTVTEVLAGFILGSLLGALVGYLLGMSPTAEFALSPYILALEIAPKVAFAPLFILWMGFTVYPKILVAILIGILPGDGQRADRNPRRRPRSDQFGTLVQGDACADPLENRVS